MDLEVVHLPYDIPVAPVHRTGYVPSATGITSLQDSILPPCERSACAFRGNLVPPLLSASEGLHSTARIARSKAAMTGKSEFGYLFRTTIHARIAQPSPSMAATLAASEDLTFGMPSALLPRPVHSTASSSPAVWSSSAPPRTGSHFTRNSFGESSPVDTRPASEPGGIRAREVEALLV
jgi:hypothetical protein